MYVVLHSLLSSFFTRILPIKTSASNHPLPRASSPPPLERPMNPPASTRPTNLASTRPTNPPPARPAHPPASANARPTNPPPARPAHPPAIIRNPPPARPAYLPTGARPARPPPARPAHPPPARPAHPPPARPAHPSKNRVHIHDDDEEDGTKVTRRKGRKQKQAKKNVGNEQGEFFDLDGQTGDADAADDDGDDKLGFYHGEHKKLVIRAIIFMRLFLLNIEAYPSKGDLMKWAEKSFSASCQVAFGINYKGMSTIS